MLYFVMMLRSFQFTGARGRNRLSASLKLQWVFAGVSFLVGGGVAAPGQAANAAPQGQAVASEHALALTLEEAIQRAQANEPAFAAAMTESKAAGLDRWTARAGVLPQAIYHNQAIYTQGNNLSANSPRFIAGNGVHEYTSQAVVNDTLGLDKFADVRHADAAAARAAAELDIARRGLVATVTGLYYGVAAAESKRAIAQRAHTEAAEFLLLTGKREQAREAAHADVVKAQLLEQQRQRDMQDTEIAAVKARLELGVLVFPDPRTEYTVAPMDGASPLASQAEVQEAAAKNDPELKSALAAMAESNADVLSARADYLPDVGLNLTYGIDAPQFAVNGQDHTHNLGYSASVTVDLPVWDWLSTQRKVKQSEIRREATRVALTATQKRLIARLQEAWAEATAAQVQLASLDASVATAAESLRLTKLRYSEGEATVLEVVDAQSSFVDAENAREDGRIRYQAARADLQTLTGTM
jgi:outer membrane protein TolC